MPLMPPRPAPPTPLRPRPATSAPPPPDPLAAALVAALRPMVAEVVREALAEFAGTERPLTDLLTYEDAIREWRCSRSTIDTLRGRGLPMVLIGSSPRFPRAACLRWFESRARERQAEAAE